MTKMITVVAGALALSAGAGTTKLDLRSVTGAELECAAPGGWTFETESAVADGVETVTVRMSAPKPERPPEFSVTFDVSGAGAYDVWTSPFQAGTTLYPSYWAQWRYPSQLAESLPLVSAFGHDTNVLTVVSSEALRKVLTRMAFDPKKDRLAAGFKYFTEPEAPLAAYSVKMRLDRRRTFWADAVSSGADWMARAGGHAPAAVPSAAYEPLYSTWYAFWQDVHADVLERELAAAAKLGMKTAILDDGWQKEESRKYYSKTGDWQPVASRFPDMKGHVARVHRLGLKYMLWLSVPYVGDESAAWSRFQGKFLHYDRGSGAGVLDPRFPEVREHLIATYERVVRDWGFDGLKLDFIDEFRIHDEGDPAVKENYAGRDIKSVPEATDRLMTDILARLRAIKPDVLVEFRQNYVGPAIRKYGNMLRAADVPYNYRSNRKRIADLRLTSGKTAVHSDMLGWSPEETPEGASLPILNTIFATVQYSMKLGKLPAEQQDVIRHWIDFARVHREALLLGSFEAHHAELGYPLLAGESAAERIVGVYADSTVAKTAADKPTILLNATMASKLVVDFAADASVETFDCRGRRVGSEKAARGLSRLAVPPSGYAVVKSAAADGGDVIIENARFRLVAGADAKVRSLVLKSTGEECAAGMEGIPLFSVTQDRPFDNEMKLIHPNKRTTFPANALRREGNRLVVGFEIAPYEAAVDLKVSDSYVEFKLADFIVHKGDFDDYLRMEVPPVRSFRVLQLPVRDRKNFGDWLNASWDEKAAIGVVGTSPYADIDHERRGGFRILTADLVRGQKLKGASAALVAANGREDFLDCMDRLERDFDLPLGVESRRSDSVKAFIYHVSGPGNPENIDRHIAWAKRGGFKYMTFHIDNLTKSIGSWGLSGDYDWNEKFPNGEKDVREMLAKVKAAGIRPGLHFLHTHIGLKSRYVTPVADPRLNKTRRFTLAKPVPATGDVTELAVFEPTEGVTLFPACRILQFGGELFSYEKYTTEPPYRFLGVKRGAHDTRAAAHPYGEVGGILDVSEYGKPLSCYVDQNTDLQDEIAAKIAKIYDCGFEYAYFDGSEGVNAPCNFHVSNAQYRQWKRFGKKPLFCEGAAKTHFDWHILSGANAFDCFSAETFKEELVRFPVAQAPLSWQDMTRVNFGWWAFWKKGNYDWWGRLSTGTKPDHWQFACSQCLAWDCPATVLVNVDHLESDRANAEACFEVMRLWEEARSRKLLTQEQKDMLKDTSREFHLSIVDGKAVLTERKK